MEVDTIKQEPEDLEEVRDETPVIEFDKLSYEEKIKYVTPVAKPLAPKKLSKKILKLIRKAKSVTTKESGLRFGLKNVQRRIRLGEKGMVFIAGDVTPFDVFIHLPIVCEDNNIPYCYLPMRNDIGTAMGIANRGPIIVLVNPNNNYEDIYDSIWKKIKLLPMPL